ncbi:putative zinc-type alcohol dehydrogenase-like protein C16A3.02c [Mollisia scopiformis]|uniref:Putative zinc-type alcohol dehydrogenase-like protein C16A3.02c n=1 Tax=Mollisia scopiformis TaxID=149040 RepID=A0A132BFN5_MOLSC|nr:putative zinc-type alcohol dehydrogenase-like protein C16A3.02c [Mollisia scopiformis]KUJ10527.1 putative zinc-type alcohol dehydrogenase-like protein C16A3.02c [Mollisia scopiformis]
MAKTFSPSVSTMKAWQYTTTKGGLEKNLKLNPSTPLPTPTPNQHLIQIIGVALNPVDYKLCELPLVTRFLVSKPATPCVDFAGCIVTPASGSDFKPGQLVFGVSGSSPLSGGALREFNVAGLGNVVAVPEGVDPLHACGVGVAGLTAYQSIVPRVKKGGRVFINGGSGGVGAFGIQIAKVVGCHVTTTCSTRNVDLCKSLGADEVVDYTKGSIVQFFREKGWKFDHVVDNVGSNEELVWKCGDFLNPGVVFIKVSGDLSLHGMIDGFKRKVVPGALGGVKGKVEGFWPKPKAEDLDQIAEWMKEGKVKAVIDHTFSFEEAPKAFEKLKTGRARGKIVVDVASKTYTKAWETAS